MRQRGEAFGKQRIPVLPLRALEISHPTSLDNSSASLTWTQIQNRAAPAGQRKLTQR
ncbi:hypothetical protein E3U43_015921 [Larimichthys crocea]|uniref:Uncharacterized protein n=1 Tax=Larimichthys crocea TaxID=215358 RepID=A0ACD3QG93_LARCR|nr:hypothetical protein E3U43_015921 [Larimichthys crocea]